MISGSALTVPEVAARFEGCMVCHAEPADVCGGAPEGVGSGAFRFCVGLGAETDEKFGAIACTMYSVSGQEP